MNNTEQVIDAVGKIKEEEDALDQSVALNKIVVNLLKTKAEENKRLWIALVLSILVNLAIVGGFLWYESQWEYTTTTTTDIVQDTDGEGSNLLQVGGGSRMVFGLEEEASNGEAISENNNYTDSQP